MAMSRGTLPRMSTHARTVESLVDEHIEVATSMRSELVDGISAFAEALIRTYDSGRKVIAFGNGGSAADAQHLAGELTGRFRLDRRSLPAIALTTDSSVLTSIANDYDYASVFARQVEAHCAPADLVVALSTSGRSPSILRGVQAARERGGETWALTGGDGGPLRAAAEHALVVPSSATARIQEMHITIIHVACAILDEWAVSREASPTGG
jgi:D-sedoheptulose 7-phosphate isomerase